MIVHFHVDCRMPGLSWMEKIWGAAGNMLMIELELVTGCTLVTDHV